MNSPHSYSLPPVVDRVLTAIKQKTVSGARTAKIVISGVMRLAARHGAVTINAVREAARIASEPARVWDLPDLTVMMLATGCRIGERLALGRDEVDLDQAVVDVRWRLVRRTGVWLLRLASTKSGEGGERLIPLPSWAVTMLKRRRLAHRPGHRTGVP